MSDLAKFLRPPQAREENDRYHDVREPQTWPISEPFRSAYLAWLEAHGINPHETVRTEHRVIDAPLVRVYQYARDEDGHRYIDPAIDRLVIGEPFDVLITSPAPRPEDYVTEPRRPPPLRPDPEIISNHEDPKAAAQDRAAAEDLLRKQQERP